MVVRPSADVAESCGNVCATRSDYCPRGQFLNARSDKAFGDTYSALGKFLFRLSFHSVERVTWWEEFRTLSFERGHVHVFCNCSIAARCADTAEGEIEPAPVDQVGG